MEKEINNFLITNDIVEDSFEIFEIGESSLILVKVLYKVKISKNKKK
jgi:hypothetical protein